ncbi:hypothetical protein Sango_2288800 [Sesamum angolense]|uniref:Reverse transcriptase domain-containing protein n=1 Tax=Sesamum angolense TaxID=2727404 RepID=A0AAE1WA34_9LAMI|nr:hypothetical protein Sango_2288800 [Sesamum angolense]
MGPFSPYLFMCCVEVFSSLIREEEGRGVIQGVPTSKRGPRVTHLLFVDNTLIFCQASRDALSSIREVLHPFEVLSRLMITLEKSAELCSGIKVGIEKSTGWRGIRCAGEAGGMALGFTDRRSSIEYCYASKPGGWQ